MSGPRRGRLLPSMLLLLVSVLVTLGALELAFRAARVPVGTVQINRATVRRSPNPRLRFDLRPGAVAAAEVEYRVNTSGLRGPEVGEAKPAGVTRVAVLGDSIAFGYWVAEEDAFPRQLERLLNAGPAARRVEVLNFGVPGYNLDQTTEVLRSRVLRFAPDAVVLALCLNDLESALSYEYGLTVDRSARRQSVAGRVADALLEHSRLFAWIEYRLAEREGRRAFVRTRNPMPGPLYAEAVSQQQAELQARFDVLAVLLREAGGVPGLVAVFPTFGERFDRYPHRDLHRAVMAAARRASLAAVDLLDCFAAYDFRAARVDVVHPSPLGHRVAAHAIHEALCAAGLPCPAPPRGRCTDYRPRDFAVVRGY
ncbi:MAG TPA: SGNH/GDSL hydrolase family protein [Vicinamibacteria bacterium]|nr:SGNH/GDSL hydrolase family protein [Vicinamibacteria bacterium]